MELDWKRAFTGLNVGFAQVCPYQSLLRTVRSESRHFGHTPVQDRSNDTKGNPQNGLRVAPEVQQYVVIRICPVFGVAQACFYLRLRSKTYRFGHTPVEGRSDNQRGKP